MNQQCDKMSKLVFVAIQFGVTFVVIYILRHYVDEVCQRYLHHFIHFENFVIFEDYSMILSLFYLFSNSFYIIPYMDLRPWEATFTWNKFCCFPIG